MGGFGSGLWRTFSRQCTVEESVALDAAWLTREQAFDPGGCLSARMIWRDGRTHEPLASVDYRVLRNRKLLLLSHAALGEADVETYSLRLSTTKLPWGGKRWWLHCPLLRDGVACEARGSKLYLPPGGRYFGCRKCFGLTYESCQDSHRFDKLFRLTGEELGVPGFDAREEQAFWREEKKRKRQYMRNEQRRRRRKAMNWS